MAKRKSSIAKLTRSVAKRRRSNPDGAVARAADTLQDVVAPAVIGYAAARIAGRIAYKLARKRSPRLAKHLGAITPGIVTAGTYAVASMIESTERYRAGFLAGGGIATAQSLLQSYVPQYGWVLNDYHMNDAAPQQFVMPQPQQRQALPASAAVVPSTDSTGTEDLSDIADGLSNDDDFIDQLEEQASGQVIQFPG